MIEFEEYKLKLNDLKPKLEALAASLNLDRVRNELERFHAMQEAPGFWDDPDRSQKIVVQTKLLEAKLEKYHAMTAQMEDLLTICEMALEENDDSMLPELQEGFEELSQRGGAAGDPAHRGVRRQQCAHVLPRRSRWHGGPGLVPDALPDVHPLGRTPRLHV